MLQSGRDFHLLDYLEILKKYRGQIVLSTVLCFFAAFAANQIVTPVYEAESKLLIEEKLEDVNLTKNLLLPYQKEFFDTQKQILESDPVFEATVLALKLHEEVTPPGIFDALKVRIKSLLGLDFDLSEDQKLRDSVDKAIRKLKKKIFVDAVRGTNILVLSVEDTDPEVAQITANRLADEFIRRSLHLKNQDSLDAARFLDEQVATIRQRLNASEKRLEDFQFSEEAISLDKRIEFLVEKQIVVAEKDYEDAVLELEQERERVEVLAAQVQAERSRRSSGDRGTDRMLNEQQILLEIKLTELKRKFTEEHPEVVSARRSLAMLSERLAKEQTQATQGLQQSSNELLQGLEKDFSEAQRNYRVYSVRVEQLLIQLGQHREKLRNLLKKKADFLVLQRELTADETLYELLLKRSKEVGVESGLNIGHVKLIQPATLPVYPVKPKKLINLVLGLVTGFFLGIGLAFLRDYLDQSLRTREEIQALLPDLALMGVFSENALLRKEKHLLPTLVQTNPNSMMAENFKILRANLELYLQRGIKTVLVTSSVPAEGKSTIVSNLAIAFAHLGRRVLLMDGDLRKPKQHQFFRSLDANQFSKTQIENLYFFKAPEVTNTTRYLRSEEFLQILESAKSQFDIVLIDSAPLTLVSDTSDFIGLDMPVLLVVGSGRVTEADLGRCLQNLKNLDAKLLGFVLSRMPEVRRNQEYQAYYEPYVSN